MKKIYFTLVLLMAAVASTYADKITDLDSLRNDQAYYITPAQSSRGTWYFNPEHPETLYGTAVAGVDASYEDPNCQFAFLHSPKGFLYFYSIGGKKFVYATGDHYVYTSDEPKSAQNQLVTSSNKTYNWVAQDNGYHFNISKDQYNGLLSSWWSLSDKGNCIKIEPIDSVAFDPTEAMAKINEFEQTFSVVNITYNEVFGDSILETYTQQKLINLGQPCSFDGPKSYFALKATDDTHEEVTINEDQDITITYNFVTDEDALPFKTISSDATAFPDDTPWYFMTLGGKYATLQEDGTTLMVQESNDHPINRSCLYAFTGDPVYGFQIHCMVTDDPAMGLQSTGVDAETIAMGDNSTSFRLENYSNDYQFSLATNNQYYIKALDDNSVITYNNYGNGCGETGVQVTFARMTDAEKEMLENDTETLPLSSVSPEEGIFNGIISTVKVYYDGNIGTIKTDGDENLIKVYDGEGNLYTSVYGKIDEEDASCMIIDFGENTLSALDKTTYTVVIPEKTIYGENDEMAQGTTLTYNVIGEFKPVTVVGRLWNKILTERIDDTPILKHTSIDYITSSAVCDFVPFNGQEYLECTVNALAKNEAKIYGFDGMAEDSIDVVWDNDGDWGDILKIDGYSQTVIDGYPLWYAPSTLPAILEDDADYAGNVVIYLNAPGGGSNAHFYPNDQYGYISLTMYDWIGGKYCTFYLDYYTDDRYNTDKPATAIEGVTPQQSVSTGTYNLAGQRVSGNLPKGIYIRNGRKFIVK